MSAVAPGDRPGRLDVGVIGAGRVGAVLGSALREAGHRVVAASGDSEASRTRIDAMLPGVERCEPQEVAARADVVLVTVPDDDLAAVVGGIAALDGWRPGQIVIHASGLHGLAALAPAADAGAMTLAIHPAMTFTGTSLDLARLRGASFAVTAAAALLPIGQALVVEIGGEPFVLDNAARPLYHAALVHGANHVAAAVSQATQLLADAGVEDPGKVLGPLAAASVDGAARDVPGGVGSLTGPVVRADVGTLRAHLAALAPYPAALEAYRAGAIATARLALAGGRIREAQFVDVMTTLEGEA